MKNKKIIILLSLIFFLNIFVAHDLRADTKNASRDVVKAQETAANADALKNKAGKDVSGDEGIIFKVMLITLITWTALGIYIYHLNRKVKNLEKKIDSKNS